MNLSAETTPSVLIERLRKVLTTPTDKISNRQLIFWFSFSLTCAAMFGLLGLRTAFSNPYVVQDDVRQHVFWMQRFLDPELFPNDLIADYFASVAQPGYKVVYQLGAGTGINYYRLLLWCLSTVTTCTRRRLRFYIIAQPKSLV